MNTHAEKRKENTSRSAANAISQNTDSNSSTTQFVDSRPEAITQRKLQRAVNNSSQLNPGSTANQTIQRLESGEDYSHKKLGKEAENNDWWNKDDGEFLAPPEITSDYEQDTYQYEMHYHQYNDELEKSDDEVSISGHGVWAKSDGKSRRQKYSITSKKAGGGHWYIDNSSLGDLELGFEENKNPDAKGKLLGAFGDLTSIVKDTMNSDGNDSDSD